MDFLVDTARRLIALFPSLKHVKVLRQWAGIRSVSPDGRPILGKVDEIPGLILANGLSGLGFQIAPITGKLFSELIVDGETAISLEPFNIRRFEKPVTKTYDVSSLVY